MVCRRELLTEPPSHRRPVAGARCWRAWLGLAERGPPAACPEPLSAERVDRARCSGPSTPEPGRAAAAQPRRRPSADEAWQKRSSLRRRAAALRAPASGGCRVMASAVEQRRLQDLLRVLATPWSAPNHSTAMRAPAGSMTDRSDPRQRAPSARVRALRGIGRDPDAKPAVIPQTGGRQRTAPGGRRPRGDRGGRRLRLARGKGVAAVRGFSGARARDHRRPGGAGRARNEALRDARGEWVAFLDDDDSSRPSGCAHISTRQAQRTSATAARSSSTTTAARSARCPHPPLNGWRSGCATAARSVVRARSSPEPSCSVRSGASARSCYALGDWDLWLKLAARANAVAIPDLLVAYTAHPSNMHLNAPERVLADFRRFERRHDLDPRRRSSCSSGSQRTWRALDAAEPRLGCTSGSLVGADG